MTPTAISSSTSAHQKVDAASVTSPTPEQQKAAREFEAIFLRQLMSSLEKGGGMGGQSSGGQVFRSMMVSALADTASEGGGIGLSELILKAMLPPSPQGKPDLSLHAAAPNAAAPHAGATSAGGEQAGVASGALGDPAAAPADTVPWARARWGTPSRVLTEARPAPMLEVGAMGRAGAIREGSGR
jgi:Rod binding domain-containing protein